MFLFQEKERLTERCDYGLASVAQWNAYYGKVKARRAASPFAILFKVLAFLGV